MMNQKFTAKKTLTASLVASAVALLLVGCDSGSSSNSQDKALIQELQTKVSSLEQQLAQAGSTAEGDMSGDASALEAKVADLEKQLAAATSSTPSSSSSSSDTLAKVKNKGMSNVASAPVYLASLTPMKKGNGKA